MTKPLAWKMYGRVLPVGHLERGRRCDSTSWCGRGPGRDPHSAEPLRVVIQGVLFGAVPPILIAVVTVAHRPVAVLQVHGVQVPVQLKGDRARPAVPADRFAGLHLCMGPSHMDVRDGYKGSLTAAFRSRSTQIIGLY